MGFICIHHIYYRLWASLKLRARPLKSSRCAENQVLLKQPEITRRFGDPGMYVYIHIEYVYVYMACIYLHIHPLVEDPVPNSIPDVVSGTRVLKQRVDGPSGKPHCSLRGAINSRPVIRRTRLCVCLPPSTRPEFPQLSRPVCRFYTESPSGKYMPEVLATVPETGMKNTGVIRNFSCHRHPYRGRRSFLGKYI